MEAVEWTVTLDDVAVSLALPEGDHITAEIIATGEFYESELLRHVRSLHIEGVYFDIGAHVGNHTLAFAEAMPSTRVVAIEPDQKSYRLLERNVRHHPKIFPMRCAVHDRFRRANIVRQSGTNSGMNRVVEGDEVMVRTLDNIVHQQQPALIKIDVEGSELAVIASGRSSLSAPSLRCLVVEAGDETVAAVDAALADHGFVRGRRFCHTPTYLYHRQTA